MSASPWPLDIAYDAAAKILNVRFDDGKVFALPAEYLRVESPSAEVQGHGPGQEVLQIAKEKVLVLAIDPVGQYAVRLRFDDGHDTGLYTWKYLRELGETHTDKWARYLERLDGIGYVRKPPPAA